MDNDSEESKEVDAALLAQCTCGGVANSRACAITCAIFAGCATQLTLDPPEVPVEYGRAFRNALKQLEEREGPVQEAHRLLDSATRYISGMGGNVEMTEDHLTLLRKALTTVGHVANVEPRTFCPSCGSAKISESVEDKELSFFTGEVKGSFKVIMTSCADCKLGWLDHRAEEAEMQAIYELLYKEVDALRQIGKARDRELEHHRALRAKVSAMFQELKGYFS